MDRLLKPVNQSCVLVLSQPVLLFGVVCPEFSYMRVQKLVILVTKLGKTTTSQVVNNNKTERK